MRWFFAITGVALFCLVWIGSAGNVRSDEVFMPHSHCFLYNRSLIALHGFSDLAIGLAYVGISVTLVYLVFRARRKIPFYPMILTFAAFIVSCGVTHLMEVWTLESTNPPYWLAGNIKLFTAIVSLATAVVLPKVVPNALGLIEEANLSAERKVQIDEAKAAAKENKRIDEALRLREVTLRREIHHRVKNNLQVISSLIYLQSLRISDEMTLEMLREIQTRARSIALIHERLYQTEGMTQIDFGDYIKQLGEDLLHAYHVSHGRINLSHGGHGIFLDLDTAMPCGLIVTELVSNALKNGFPPERKGKVEVDLQRAGDGLLQLTVNDDGVGLPPNFDLARSSSLGLKLVRDLTQQIGGTLKLRNEGGTSVAITFPAPPQPAGA